MLKQQAIPVLERLEQNGFEAYFVGGCVRDWLLGRSVHDIDICTNALPDDVMRLFPEHVPTGLKHGTVSVKQGPYLFEVTTYRLEAEYEAYRRPLQVQFVSDLATDLSRRDFTINAMAMDRHDRLVDPYAGHNDLNERLIRAVGDAVSRFQEDALRPLRGARFAAQLGFAIESATLRAMEQTAPLLSHIAAERIREELTKLLDSDHPQIGCEILVSTGLLQSYPLLAEVFQRSRQEIWRAARLGSYLHKWSFLCFAADFQLEQVCELTSILRMSKREQNGISRYAELLFSLSPQWDRPKPINWGPLLLSDGWEVCIGLDMLLQAIWWNNRDRSVSQSLIDTHAALPVTSLKELAVSGKDLQQAFARKPGDWIGRILSYLLEQTALHGLPNRREELLQAAKKELEKHEH
ncbi:CCA tRNA nucleotidyltransferase [Brevibacillus humidisoli]|uniref:CCA tRNA nucleotidyltransferase n=1 Tax=Brevibacillus humidisoli TaxID=2895522 RepID=UPI001E42ADE8|nr:CCA tRNA nucleotidyltransferase [Brevibacillus humidisoli]UFJ42749.1 CCA tRNA nucleotidyltransferase [Brevibacillus humidisoli]